MGNTDKIHLEYYVRKECAASTNSPLDNVISRTNRTIKIKGNVLKVNNVILKIGDRILIQDSGDHKKNGIYCVHRHNQKNNRYILHRELNACTDNILPVAISTYIDKLYTSTKAIGVIGIPGPIGHSGKQGDRGPAGRDGKTGQQGLQGDRGLPGKIAVPTTQKIEQVTKLEINKEKQTRKMFKLK